MSQPAMDFRNLYKDNAVAEQVSTSVQGKILQIKITKHSDQKRKVDVSKLLQDYEINQNDNILIRDINVEQFEQERRHPTEALLNQREALDYSKMLSKKDLLLLNLPRNITEQEIQKMCSIKNVNVRGVKLIHAFDGESVAGAIVSVLLPSQVKTLKDGLYNHWIIEKKLRTRTMDELTYETFNERTLMVRNLPKEYTTKDVLDIFNNFGVVMRVEMLFKDTEIEKLLQHKQDQDPFSIKKQENIQKQLNRTHRLIKDSIQTEEEYQAYLESHLGQQESQNLLSHFSDVQIGNNREKQLEVLDTQRKISLQTLLGQLQTESLDVKYSKDYLQQLLNKLNEIPGLKTSTEAQSLIPQDEGERDILVKTLKYISRNKDNVDEEDLSSLSQKVDLQKIYGSDPIQQLQSLSREHLAEAYDNLINILKQRENLIQERIESQINHLGKEERILFDSRDFTREFETIKPFDLPFGKSMSPEDALSVNDQIQSVLLHKNFPIKKKLEMIMDGVYNYHKKANFDKASINFSDTPQFSKYRMYPQIEPGTTQTMARMFFEGAPLKPQIQKKVDEMVKERLDNQDLPFDELYHKEKKVVDQVVKAYQQLKEREQSLPDPFGSSRKVSPGEISEEILEEKGFSLQSSFQRDQKRENDKLLRQGFDSTESNTHSGYLTENQNALLKLVEDGVISRDDYEKYKTAQLFSSKVNLGYAFVTYTTVDEAKISSILASNIIIENQIVEVSPKGTLEHRDLDQKFVMNQMKNDSRMSTEFERLRQAKQELRDFEKNLDKDMPKLKQIERFKEVARDLIENDKKNSRITVGRDSKEEELVNDKIRQLQRENPDIDMTQLFDTERAELIRKNQHKKAFASYKAYEFLKHGVEMTKKQNKEDKVSPRKSNDTHEFPPIQDTLARFLTKDKYIDMIDRGEASDKPGRKFNYTERDFFEAYFGKDYARRQTVDIDKENPLLGYNRTFKEKYPLENYFRMPEFEKKRKQFLDNYGFDPEDRYNEKFAVMQNAMNTYQEDISDFINPEHPTEEDRTFFGDIGAKMESVLKNPKRQSNYEDYKIVTDREMKLIRKQVRDEFYPSVSQQATQAAKKATEIKNVVEDTKQVEKFEPYYNRNEKSIKTTVKTPTLDDLYVKQQSYESEEMLKQQQEEEEQERKIAQAEPDNEGIEEIIDVEANEYEDEDVLDRQYGDLMQKDGTERLKELGVNKEILRLNRNLAYELKDVHKHNGGYNMENDFELQRLQRMADDQGITLPELLEDLKGGRLILDQLKDFPDEYQQNNRLGITSNDFDVKSRQHKASKNLQSFARESESEREDEDIYRHYVNKMNQEKERRLQENKEKLQKEEVTVDDKQKELIESMFPDIPRFEGYFNSMSKGQHPFEDDKYKVKDNFEEDEKIRLAEVEHEEELYSRELIGRLMGEKLTPRQFSVLFNAEGQEKVNMLLNSGAERAMYLDNRKKGELVREMTESYKRNMIHQGEWTEQNADANLQKFIQKTWEESQVINKTDSRKEVAEKLSLMQQFMTPKQLLEKEYYFDEGLGESVNDHVAHIKEKFPDVDVSVRRDRDGFPLIKTVYRPHYKYDLENLLSYDAEKEHKNFKESAETLLKSIMPFGADAAKNPSKLSKEQLQQSIKILMPYQQNGQEHNAPDAVTTRKIEQLVNERMNGKYANDTEGYAKAFLELAETASFDQSKKLTQVNRLNPSLSKEDAQSLFREVNDEQELFQREISAQILERVREYILLKERKPTDFITNKRSEHKLFSEQVHKYESSANYLEDQANQMDKDEPLFDKEAYRQLKAEIKSRREAKERLLQQGFPELKPYLTF